MSGVNDYCYETFEIGPFFCSVYGDGDEITLQATSGDFEKLRKTYPLGTTLGTIQTEAAEWAMAQFTTWAKQANALKGDA